ncbi:MAG: hypothetical protein JWO88_3591 [Frankiales bacterium]|nr:hypothetical protein [Frankiales bacterium]
MSARSGADRQVAMLAVRELIRCESEWRRWNDLRLRIDRARTQPPPVGNPDSYIQTNEAGASADCSKPTRGMTSSTSSIIESTAL